MRGSETKVILELFDKCINPSLLNNCESWTLSSSEEEQIDKIGVRAIKRLFSLPTTTPSVAVIFNLGLLYTTQIVDQKRFLYLHKILNLQNNHWNRQMLAHLQNTNLGWAKNITEKLSEYELETRWEVIRTKTKGQWREEIRRAINNRNKQRLIENCTTISPSGTKINTKTKEIHTKLTTEPYNRQPPNEIVNGNKQKTKTIILARHGMLECGKNFKGTLSLNCNSCNVVDDENHRLNDCNRWRDTNNASSSLKCNFRDIYSTSETELNDVINNLEKIWEFKYANGRMRKQ